MMLGFQVSLKIFVYLNVLKNPPLQSPLSSIEETIQRVIWIGELTGASDKLKIHVLF